MAHHIYTTDAFVLDSTLVGEADRFYSLFTKDLGLVRATARGVRLQKSKLRYSLQEFSRVTVSLVRGKEVWRITSAKIQHNLHAHFRENKNTLAVVAQIISLVKRLVVGEEKNEALFEILSDAFDFLEKHTFAGAELKYFEIISVLKILENLGYLRQVKELRVFVDTPWSQELIKLMEPKKAEALREINMSLRETQL